MELEIELVPSTAWYSNLRNKISKEEWDKIRKQSYVDSNHRCSICNADGRLNCHESWEYDDKKYIQKLKGFVALCDNCHMVKHIGFASIQANKGLLDMKELIKHFIKVNKVNEIEFKKHQHQSFREWERRSKNKWEIDLSKWALLIKKQ